MTARSTAQLTDGWSPADVLLIMVVTIGGIVQAAPLAVAGFFLQVSLWDGGRPDYGTRLTGLGYIVLAGFLAAAGPILAAFIHRSWVAAIVGVLVIGLGVAAAVVVGVVTA